MDKLNPEQQASARHTYGPALVNAGPGTGKTELVVKRVVNLVLNHGVDPSEILALTFTNKAANEMRSRIVKSGGESCYPVVVGTFHSFVLRYILKPNRTHDFFKASGYPNGFITLDEEDTDRIIDDIIKRDSSYSVLAAACDLNRKKLKSRLTLERANNKTSGDFLSALFFNHGGIKNDWDSMVQTAAMVNAENESDPNMEVLVQNINQKEYLFDAVIGHIWQEYDRLCQDVDGIDYDQMLLLAERLLAHDESLARRLGSRFNFIIQDEYQDTNPVQYSLIARIAKHQKHPFTLFNVGDGRQGIYGFRAADMTILTKFPERHAECKIFNLIRNYRSSQPIIESANKFALTMPGQLTQGSLLAEGSNKNEVQKPQLHRFADDRNEAGWLVEQVKKNLASGVPANEIFILYRKKALNACIESELVRGGIPYQIVGDKSFWESREVKDVVSLLRVLSRSSDVLALARVIENSSSGMKGNTFRKQAKEAKLTPWDFLINRMNGAKPGNASAIFIRDLYQAKLRASNVSDWHGWLFQLIKKINHNDGIVDEDESERLAHELLRIVIRDGHDFEQYRKDFLESPENNYKTIVGEFDVIRESRNFWLKYMAPVLREEDQKRNAKNGGDIGKFELICDERHGNVMTVLQYVEKALEKGILITDVIDEITLKTEDAQQQSDDMVQMMTLHGSKGLEADVVFLIGAEEETFHNIEDAESPSDGTGSYDEEGRIFYVGITRAKKELYLSSAAKRRLHGKEIKLTELKFLADMHLIEHCHDGLAPMLSEETPVIHGHHHKYISNDHDNDDFESFLKSLEQENGAPSTNRQSRISNVRVDF